VPPLSQVTLFAPLDSGWSQFATDQGITLQQLTANATTLAHVALYHISPRVATPGDLRTQPQIPTMWGGRFLYGDSQVSHTRWHVMRLPSPSHMPQIALILCIN
jgi:hypothetical protein